MIRKYAEIFCWKNVSSFCSAKATHIFSAKNIRILCIEFAKTVNEMILNELVKLTTLWTTGPRFSSWVLLLTTFFTAKIHLSSQILLLFLIMYGENANSALDERDVPIGIFVYASYKHMMRVLMRSARNVHNICFFFCFFFCGEMWKNINILV